MTLITLDPSSTVVGYSVSTAPNTFPDAGLIWPEKKSADAWTRIKSLMKQVGELLDEHYPDHVLIEQPSGHVHRRALGAGGHGQATYGFAAGAVWATCDIKCPKGAVELINANTWTHGVSKKTRASTIAYRFPWYRLNLDPGMDQADAIGLACWWWLRNGGTR